jgi:predicted DNA-binding ribbon-helix-helix protein
MTTKKMVSFRLDAAVIDLLKDMARKRNMSVAALFREIVLKEAYK